LDLLELGAQFDEKFAGKFMNSFQVHDLHEEYLKWIMLYTGLQSQDFYKVKSANRQHDIYNTAKNLLFVLLLLFLLLLLTLILFKQ
jgi:hypothetical protein